MSEDPNRRAGSLNPQAQPESSYYSQTNHLSGPHYGQQGDQRMSQQDNYNRQYNPQSQQGADPIEEQDAESAHQYYQTGQQPSNQGTYSGQQPYDPYEGYQTRPANSYYQGQDQPSAPPGYDPHDASAYQPQPNPHQYSPHAPAYPPYQPGDHAQPHNHQDYSANNYSDQQSSQFDYSQYSPQPESAPGAQSYEQPLGEIEDAHRPHQSSSYGAGFPYGGSSHSEHSTYTPDYDYAQAGAGYPSEYQAADSAHSPEAAPRSRDYEPEFTTSGRALAADPSGRSEPSFSGYDRNSDFEQHYGFEHPQNYEQPRELAKYSQLEADTSYSDHAPQTDADFFDEYNEDAYGDFAEEPKKRKPLVIAGALVGALAFGGALAVAYKFLGFGDSVNTASNPPLIQADKSPVKEKPKLAGGKEFPNRNKLIYDRLQDNENKTATPERIVPRQEQVFDTASIANSLNNSDSSAPKASSSPQVGTSAESSNSGSPRKVKTLMIKPDGTIVKQSSSGATIRPQISPVESSATSSAQVQPVAQPSVTSSATKPIPQRLSATPQLTPPSTSGSPQNVAALPKASSTQQSVAAPTQKPKQTTAAVSPAATSTTSSSSESGYAVQVAARRSQTEALAAFADLQQKYSSLLTSYRPIIQRADLGEKGVFYRLRVGPMQDKNVATSLCNKLKSAGLKSCWVLSL